MSFSRSDQPTIKATERSLSLDAYRGAIMIALVSGGFGFHALEGHPFWGILAISAAALIISGLVVEGLGIPIIKRVLSTSFTLFSTGWAILFLLVFYWVIEAASYRR